MENATKALIMVAGVLIGVLLLSLAVWLFRQGGGAAASVADQIKGQQVSQFNRQFDKYISAEENSGVTIYDVVTVGSLARTYNLENDLKRGDNGYITVLIHNFTKNSSGVIEYKQNNLINPPLELSDRDIDDDEFRRITEEVFAKDRENIQNTMSTDSSIGRSSDDASKLGYLRIYSCMQDKLKYNGPDRKNFKHRIYKKYKYNK